MRLTRIKRAHNIDVEKWLIEALNLNDYQRSKMRSDEIVHFSPFYFCEEEEIRSSNAWWRLALLLIPIYYILIAIWILFKWLFTGDRYLPEKFIKKFHYPWMRKLGINWA